MTLEELSAEFGVSRERVRQIEVRALKRCRPRCAKAWRSWKACRRRPRGCRRRRFRPARTRVRYEKEKAAREAAFLRDAYDAPLFSMSQAWIASAMTRVPDAPFSRLNLAIRPLLMPAAGRASRGSSGGPCCGRRNRRARGPMR